MGPVSDAGLGEFAQLTSVAELDLADCGCITDTGVERLASLVNLERPHLCGCLSLSANAPLRLALRLLSTEVRHRIQLTIRLSHSETIRPETHWTVRVVRGYVL